MANVTEVSNFDTGIYQLETTDPLEGGALGVLNYAIKGLANRTKWLKDNLALKPKNIGYITGVDINGFTVGHNYAVGGNITGAVITQDISLAEVVRITMANSMGNTNYKVQPPSIQSLGSLDTDNNILPIVWRPISATQFDVILEEINTGTQNLRIHFEVISLD